MTTSVVGLTADQSLSELETVSQIFPHHWPGRTGGESRKALLVGGREGSDATTDWAQSCLGLHGHHNNGSPLHSTAQNIAPEIPGTVGLMSHLSLYIIYF